MTIEAQERISAVEFGTKSRVHVGINVSSIEKSLPFYKVLFGQEPTKLRPGYAKFEVAEPPVNFTLNENPAFQAQPNAALSHMGIQVKSTAEVLAAKDRFVQSSLATFDEENVTCCYAVQDKVWVTDPDGNQWEVFVVLEADSPVHSIKPEKASDGFCCATTPATASAQTIALTNKSEKSGCC